VSAAEIAGFPLVCPVAVRWGDMDALGHVNNSVYFTWFESARIALFERVGLIAPGATVGPILARVACDFRRPVIYPKALLCGARVTEVRQSSVAIEHLLVDAGEPEAPPFARGESVIVLYDYARAVKVPIDDDLRRKLGAFAAGGLEAR
jgi:acyl-CoA thioester hydrolase